MKPNEALNAQLFAAAAAGDAGKIAELLAAGAEIKIHAHAHALDTAHAGGIQMEH